jgi:hypothetical protein
MAPPEKQAIVANSISQLPPGEVAGLDAGQLAALGLDSPTGLWSDWKRMSDTQAAVAAIPDNQPARIFTTLGLGDFDQANATLADAVLSAALGGPRHPVLDLDTNNDGKLDETDMPALKERAKSGGVPTLQQAVTSGKVPKLQLPNVQAALNINPATATAMGKYKEWSADGNITTDEVNSANWSDDFMKQLLNQIPQSNTMLRRPLEQILKERQDKRDKEEADRKAEEERRIEEEKRLAEEEKQREEGRKSMKRQDTRLSPGGLFGGNLPEKVKKYFGGK